MRLTETANTHETPRMVKIVRTLGTAGAPPKHDLFGIMAENALEGLAGPLEATAVGDEQDSVGGVVE